MLWTTAVRPMFTAILSFFPAQLENHTCSGSRYSGARVDGWGMWNEQKVIMKAKQMLCVTLMLLGILLGREAQAFYNPSTGRWLNRDPIGKAGGPNPNACVGNAPIAYFDVLGLWRSYEHRSLTQIAWKNARLPSGLVGITAIYKTVEDANIAVDSGASADDLRRHYNRGLSEDISFAQKRYSE